MNWRFSRYIRLKLAGVFSTRATSVDVLFSNIYWTKLVEFELGELAAIRHTFLYVCKLPIFKTFGFMGHPHGGGCKIFYCSHTRSTYNNTIDVLTLTHVYIPDAYAYAKLIMLCQKELSYLQRYPYDFCFFFFFARLGITIGSISGSQPLPWQSICLYIYI